jgi:conjugal transfer mating pair stabilization protein TraN
MAQNLSVKRALTDAMSGVDPAAIIPGFTETPKEIGMMPDETSNNLRALSDARIKSDKEAREVYEASLSSHAITPDFNSLEIKKGQQTIEQSELAPSSLGCVDGACDKTRAEVSDSLNEGMVRLGALSESAKEVSDKQINKGNPSIFKGDNYTCRIAVAHVGNCCGGRARFLKCSSEEKALALAIDEGRADKLGAGGKFCAVRKFGICMEEKESWCVFPTKLGGIIQHQGRFQQLGIDFGAARSRHNDPNCRGITPEELARINFKTIDMSALVADYKNRTKLPSMSNQAQQNQSHIERLASEGLAHDE